MAMPRRLVSLIVCVSLVGCTVGPDFHAPQSPAATRYTTTPLPPETASADVAGGQSQRLVEARDIPAEWWALFKCEALDALVRRALDDSPMLAQSKSKLEKAQQDLVAHRGKTQLPKIDAGLSANRVDVSAESFDAPQLPIDTPFTLYQAQVSVSYTLDLFGKSRRELEALEAAVDYERFELEAARLMLAGNVVTAAIEEASLREQIASTESLIAVRAHAVDIAGQREQLGAIAKVEVVKQSGELAQARASLPPLRKRLDQVRNRIAILTGQLPGDSELPEIRLADLQLPGELPVTLPSELVRQRPDIKAAEALMHEASARVGVATANLYPQIKLSAIGGSLTTVFSSFLGPGTGFYLAGVSLSQSIFHGGELKAQKRSAVAALDQAGEAYHQTVLSGFQNVADTLVALDADAKTLHERADSATLAKNAYDITSQRYDAGGVSLLTLLDAERQLHSANLDQTRAIADRYADSAALFQALGGGWWVGEKGGK